MDLELGGRVVIVTGGASGIGWACARGFAREGCRVALWDQSAEVKDAAAALAAEFGGPSLGLSVDVSDFAAMQEAVRQTEAALGPIAHVVHAAALGSGKFGYPFTNLDAQRLASRAGGQCTGNGSRGACHHAGNGLAQRGNSGFSRLRRRTNRFADRSALQRKQGGQHQLRAVPGKGSGASMESASTWSVRVWCVRR